MFYFFDVFFFSHTFLDIFFLIYIFIHFVWICIYYHINIYIALFLMRFFDLRLRDLKEVHRTKFNSLLNLHNFKFKKKWSKLRKLKKKISFKIRLYISSFILEESIISNKWLTLSKIVISFCPRILMNKMIWINSAIHNRKYNKM